MKAIIEDVPDFLLEQYALGELGAADRAKVEKALAGDASLKERLAELGRSNAEILAQVPPEEAAKAIRLRMMRESAGTQSQPRGASSNDLARFIKRGMGIASAAAAVLVFGLFMLRGPAFMIDSDLTRVKGGAPSMLVFKDTPAGPIQLADSQSAAAGEVLQIKYSAGSARYGALASVDGRGVVTWHFPTLGPADSVEAIPAPALDPAGAALPQAYELDDAPAFERFFLFSSEAPFELGAIDSALRMLATSPSASTDAPELAKGLSFKSLLLLKGGTR